MIGQTWAPSLVGELNENSVHGRLNLQRVLATEMPSLCPCLGSPWGEGRGQAALRGPGGRGKGHTPLSRLGLETLSLAARKKREWFASLFLKDQEGVLLF